METTESVIQSHLVRLSIETFWPRGYLHFPSLALELTFDRMWFLDAERNPSRMPEIASLI